LSYGPTLSFYTVLPARNLAEFLQAKRSALGDFGRCPSAGNHWLQILAAPAISAGGSRLLLFEFFPAKIEAVDRFLGFFHS
jgi:hypothetical protein